MLSTIVAVRCAPAVCSKDRCSYSGRGGHLKLQTVSSVPSDVHRVDRAIRRLIPELRGCTRHAFVQLHRRRESVAVHGAAHCHEADDKNSKRTLHPERSRRLAGWETSDCVGGLGADADGANGTGKGARAHDCHEGFARRCGDW